MGKAVITANLGDGLYRARPLYDLRRLETELANLSAQQEQYSATLAQAVLALVLLEDETAVAAATVNAVLDQWRSELLKADGTPPPPILPPDPENWPDLDRAQEGPLFDAINAARTAASIATLARDSDLDAAARRQVYALAASRHVGHLNVDRSLPESRVAATGYQAVAVQELIAAGPATPAEAVATWLIGTAPVVLSTAFSECGVGYTYAPTHPATYLWCAVLADPNPTPDPDPPVVDYPDDPSGAAAREQDQALDKITLPEHAPDTPKKIGEASAMLAKAGQKERAARHELARLMAENNMRQSRVIDLEALRTDLENRVYDVWSTFYIETFAIGQEIETAEPPGYWREEPEANTVVGGGIYSQSYTYTERPWNIAAFDSNQVKPGKLAPAETSAPAATFWNAAMEPGHLKWKPLWRYGTITELNQGLSRCTVLLEPLDSRAFQDEDAPLDLNEQASLTDVLISYPPCNGYGFDVGDEVLVLFEGHDRASPKVVGFRRAPRDCNGREGWREL